MFAFLGTSHDDSIVIESDSDGDEVIKFSPSKFNTTMNKTGKVNFGDTYNDVTINNINCGEQKNGTKKEDNVKHNNDVESWLQNGNFLY